MSQTSILTRSGRTVDFQEPAVDQVWLGDLACGLEHTSRYTGQTARRYSVAEHSLLVALLVPTDLVLEALLHDAQEAYVGDLVAPLKSLCGGYREVEHRLEQVIRAKFGLEGPPAVAVKQMDMAIRLLEREVLLPPDERFDRSPWLPSLPPRWRESEAAQEVEYRLRQPSAWVMVPGQLALAWQMRVVQALLARPDSAAKRAVLAEVHP